MTDKSMTLSDFLQGKNPKHITSIKLTGQHLTALPPELLLCTNLLKLDLSDNDFTAIPKEISTFKRLRILKMAKNQLKQIHAGILHLKHLKTLDVSHNSIKTLPKQLQQSSIENLIISHNKFFSIGDYAPLVNIKKLVLTGNFLIGFCPNCELPKLEYLWFTRSIASNFKSVTLRKEFLPSLKQWYPQIALETNSKTSKPMEVVKNKVFISYSHEDEKWLKEVKKNLKALSNIIGEIDVWDDTRIKTGDKWKEEIETAMRTCRAAILIVSQSFLASDFIKDEELQPILKRAEKEGTHVFLVIARSCLFEESSLESFQSVNPPEKPLNACQEHEVDKYLVKLARDIKAKIL